MQNLPQEVLDMVLAHTAETDNAADTKRDVSLDGVGRDTIRTVRQVCSNFANSWSADQNFIRLLNEVLVRPTAARLNKFIAIGPTHAPHVTQLCLSAHPLREDDEEAIDPGNLPADNRDFLTDTARFPAGGAYNPALVKTVQHFAQITALVFYPCPPDSVKCSWYKLPPSMAVSDAYAIVNRFFEEWADEFGLDFLNRALGSALFDIHKAGVQLQSLKTPLFGNHGPHTAIPPSAALWGGTPHIKELRVNLAVNNRQHVPFPILHRNGPVNVEVIDVALSSANVDVAIEPQFLGPAVFPQLKELKIMATASLYFAEDELFLFVAAQPKLRCLSLGYITLMEGDWSSLLARLASLRLEELSLINPGMVDFSQSAWVEGSVYRREDVYYTPESVANRFKDVAKRVRVLYAMGPWHDKSFRHVSHRGIGFDYVGWTFFDQFEAKEGYERLNEFTIRHRERRKNWYGNWWRS